jgi:prolyl-tRNA synthetase
MKGVPFRIEIGPKDIAKQQLVLARRIVGEGEDRKQFLPEAEVLATMGDRVRQFQAWLLGHITDLETLSRIIDGPGGFVYTGWCGSDACEAKVAEETKATIRVIPDADFRSTPAPTSCVVCGGAAEDEVVWARAY